MTETMAYKEGEQGSVGQKRKKPVRDALVGLLSRSPDDSLNDKPATIAQRLALDLVKEAIGIGADAAKARTEIIDRLEGKAAQAIIGGEDDEPAIKFSLHSILREIDGRSSSLPESED